jgi:hypothetical protein
MSLFVQVLLPEKSTQISLSRSLKTSRGNFMTQCIGLVALLATIIDGKALENNHF